MSEEMVNNTKIKVAKKYRHAINEIEFDGEMYWVYTNKGFMLPTTECHTDNAYNQKDLLEIIRQVSECNCNECEKEL